MQAIEADCATLGALLKSMLGLLSKPQAAARLFSCEAHPQASTFTAAPAAQTLLAKPEMAGGSDSADLQVPPATHALEVGAVEAVKADPLTTVRVAAPVLGEGRPAVSQEAASDAAAREAEALDRANAWQSPVGAGAAQSVLKIGPGNFPGLAELPASQPQQTTADGSLDTQKGIEPPLASQSCTAGGVTHVQMEPQVPAERQREPSTGQCCLVGGHISLDKRQPVGAGMPAAPATLAELHGALNDTSVAGTDQQPCVPVQSARQQGTEASNQLVVAVTGPGVGEGLGVGAGTAGAGTSLHADARTGAMAGKGGKQKGGGRGGKAQGVGVQLTGSAAQAMAVLQAGMPSRPARTEDDAGQYMHVPMRFHNT